MRILIASSEAAPFAKTGGLADVAGALPKALKALGEDVALIMPFYDKFIEKNKIQVGKQVAKIQVPVSNRIVDAEVYMASLSDGVPAYLVKKPEYFNRAQLYGTPDGDFADNAERFTFFARSILEFARQSDRNIDILHLNDWQSALAAPFLKLSYQASPRLKNTRTVITVHNLGYQGVFWHLDWHLFNLGWEWFNWRYFEFYGKINFLKAGLVFSDAITTVSKKYSREILTQEFGYGLDGVLRDREKSLHGIVNGIDYDEWSPEVDKFLPAKFSDSDLSGKARCRQELLSAYGLVDDGTPVIGMVTRLSDQKGFDIFSAGLKSLMKEKLKIVILGTGEKKYHDMLEAAAKQYPKKLGVKISFDNALAHRIYAGCDMFLMPSLYEPCGLNQMIALKYGTIPVVRATGGLDDTIKEFSAASGKGTGFKFSEYTADALVKTVQKAVKAYSAKATWKKLVANAMAADFSWKESAKKYAALYKGLLKEPPAKV